jgi:hypothetical protein
VLVPVCELTQSHKNHPVVQVLRQYYLYGLARRTSTHGQSGPPDRSRSSADTSARVRQKEGEGGCSCIKVQVQAQAPPCCPTPVGGGGLHVFIAKSKPPWTTATRLLLSGLHETPGYHSGVSYQILHQVVCRVAVVADIRCNGSLPFPHSLPRAEPASSGDDGKKLQKRKIKQGVAFSAPPLLARLCTRGDPPFLSKNPDPQAKPRSRCYLWCSSCVSLVCPAQLQCESARRDLHVPEPVLLVRVRSTGTSTLHSTRQHSKS